MIDVRIREMIGEDLLPLLELYTHLHEEGIPAMDDQLEAMWAQILADPNHHILVGEEDGVLVSSCVLAVIPNLTRGPRPYALIENVVTRREYRGRGYASRILNHAREIAQEAGCYKIMLMTGSKEDATLEFYRRAGYNDRDKTAFIQWL